MESTQASPQHSRSASPTPSSASRLLNLPAEIRIMILTSVLAGSGTAQLQAAWGKHQRWLGKNKWQEHRGWHISGSLDQHSAQILRVSRQIFQEGSLILYGCNKFDLTQTVRLPRVIYCSPGPIVKRAIGGANLKIIRHIAVGVDVKLPAVFAAFQWLQSMELYVDYRSSNHIMFEELGVDEFQEEVTRMLSPRINLARLLRENIGIAFKLRVDVWHLLRGWERVRNHAAPPSDLD
jgi:hypothetical protein